MGSEKFCNDTDSWDELSYRSGKLVHRKSEFSSNSRHLVQDIE